MQHVFLFSLIQSIQFCATNVYPQLVYSDFEAGTISKFDVYDDWPKLLNISLANDSMSITTIKDGLTMPMGLALRGNLTQAHIMVGSSQSGITLVKLDGTESSTLFSGATVRGIVYKDEAVGTSSTAYIGLLHHPDNINSGIYAVDTTQGASAVYGNLLVASPCVDNLAMSLDRQTLFWSDGCSGSIQSLFLIGSNSPQTLLQYLVQPKGFAFSSDFTTMYFIANNSIFKATVSGAATTSTSAATISGIVELPGSSDRIYPTRVVVDVCSDAGKVYWADACMGRIQRANLDGTGIENIVHGLGSPLGLAIVCPEPTTTTTSLMEAEPAPVPEQMAMPTLPAEPEPEQTRRLLDEELGLQHMEMPSFRRLLALDPEPEPGESTIASTTTTTTFGCRCGLELYAETEYISLINNDATAANASRVRSEWIPSGSCAAIPSTPIVVTSTTSGPPRSPEGCLIPQDDYGMFSKQGDKPFDAWLLTCPSGYRVEGDSNRIECDEGNLSAALSCVTSPYVCTIADAFNLVWGELAIGVNCSGDATGVDSLPDSGLCEGICPNSTTYLLGNIICLGGMLTDMSYCIPRDGEYTAANEYVLHGQIRLTFSSHPDREIVRQALCLALELPNSECMYIMKAEVQPVSSRRLFGISSFMQSSRKLSQDSFLDYSIATPPSRTQKQLIDGVRLFVNGSGTSYIAFSNWLDGRGLYVTNMQETINPTILNSTVVRNANGVIQGYSPRPVPGAPTPAPEEDEIVLIVVLSSVGGIILVAIVALSVYAWRYGSCRKAEC